MGFSGASRERKKKVNRCRVSGNLIEGFGGGLLVLGLLGHWLVCVLAMWSVCFYTLFKDLMWVFRIIL